MASGDFPVFRFRVDICHSGDAFLWTIVIFIYALRLPGPGRWGAFATAIIIGSCAFLAGGLVGFLFGILRAAPNSGKTAGAGRYQANSNLVEVSDWLTKIILGVGLVQIGRVVPALTRLSASLRVPLGGQPSSSAFGIALVLANILLGFLFFYLWARSLLERNWDTPDESQENDIAVNSIAGRGIVGTAPAVKGAGLSAAGGTALIPEQQAAATPIPEQSPAQSTAAE
jgi:hypothetical protein